MAQLKLRPHCEFTVTGVSQKPELHEGYRVTLSIGSAAGVDRIETQLEIASGKKPSRFDGVLGRDFMRNFRFVYDGHAGLFELELMPESSARETSEAAGTAKILAERSVFWTEPCRWHGAASKTGQYRRRYAQIRRFEPDDLGSWLP